jgi:hypothetical protein
MTASANPDTTWSRTSLRRYGRPIGCAMPSRTQGGDGLLAMRLRSLLLTIVVLVAGVMWVRFTHVTFGVNLPWEAPRHIDICERRYTPTYPAFVDRILDSTRILVLEPTIFLMPIPVPSIRPSRPSLSYGGCPEAVVLRLRSDTLVFAPLMGGP